MQILIINSIETDFDVIILLNNKHTVPAVLKELNLDLNESLDVIEGHKLMARPTNTHTHTHIRRQEE